MMMMPIPNVMGRTTSWAASAVICRTVLSRPSGSPRRRTTFSTRTTAPSTIRPKSIAPRLMRLAEMRDSTIPVKASSIESGMAEATISPARMLPRKAKRTATTRSAPSSRFVSTVRMTRRTRTARS